MLGAVTTQGGGVDPNELVECYTDEDCYDQTTPLLMTREECCVGTAEAVGFRTEGGEICNICTGKQVHLAFVERSGICSTCYIYLYG